MRSVRLGAVAVLGLTLLLIGASPASAHVSIPDPGTKGGFSIITFSVPNERDDASTTKIEVKVPEDVVIPFFSVQPKPGWTVSTTTRTLDTPAEAEGESITEVVDTITWTGGEIGPGQFDTFSVSAGPLPEDVDEIGFPTVQTYSSGEEVSWIDPTPASGEEPEHPIPTLALMDATGDTDHGDTTATTVTASGDEETAADESEDDDSNGIAIAALVVGGLGLIAGLTAIAMGRRRTPTP